jgi:hypothetical protein
VALVRQWQVENALRMPAVPAGWPYAVTGFGLYWPWVKNVGTFRTYHAETPWTVYPTYWIDKS